MAAPTTAPTGVNAMLKEVIVPYLQDNFSGLNPTINLLFKNHDIYEGGNYIVQPIMYNLPTAFVTRYTGAQTLSPNFQINEMGALFNMKFYAIDVSIAGTDDQRMDGPATAFNLAAVRMCEAEEALRQVVGSDLYLDGTTYPLGITGFGAMIDDGTNVSTYAAINRTSVPVWAAYYNANGGTARALTINLLDTLWVQTAWGTHQIQAILASRNMAMRIYQLGYSMQRQLGGDMLSLGTKCILYRGMPVIIDDNLPQFNGRDQIYGINPDTMQIYTKRGRFMKWRPFQTVDNQDTISGKILLGLAFTGNRPRSNGRIVDLNYALT